MACKVLLHTVSSKNFTEFAPMTAMPCLAAVEMTEGGIVVGGDSVAWQSSRSANSLELIPINVMFQKVCQFSQD
jgi:hypothetical protein